MMTLIPLKTHTEQQKEVDREKVIDSSCLLRQFVSANKLSLYSAFPLSTHRSLTHCWSCWLAPCVRLHNGTQPPLKTPLANSLRQPGIHLWAFYPFAFHYLYPGTKGQGGWWLWMTISEKMIIRLGAVRAMHVNPAGTFKSVWRRSHRSSLLQLQLLVFILLLFASLQLQLVQLLPLCGFSFLWS